MAGEDKMRVTWITKDLTPAVVDYGTASGRYTNSSSGVTSTYRYLIYKSGHIHDVVIGPLTPNTVYYYRCSSNSAHEYRFKTPPAQFPIKFVITGMCICSDFNIPHRLYILLMCLMV